MSDFSIAIANEQTALKVNEERLRKAIIAVLAGAGLNSATVSLAIVDDAEIHTLNREFLEHDYPTDALSFLLDGDGATLDGEIIVSAETAARAAPDYGWSAGDELLLYVIHAALHLVGYDDQEPAAEREMRARETEYLLQFGVTRAATPPASAAES